MSENWKRLCASFEPYLNFIGSYNEMVLISCQLANKRFEEFSVCAKFNSVVKIPRQFRFLWSMGFACSIFLRRSRYLWCRFLWMRDLRTNGRSLRVINRYFRRRAVTSWKNSMKRNVCTILDLSLWCFGIHEKARSGHEFRARALF